MRLLRTIGTVAALLVVSLGATAATRADDDEAKVAVEKLFDALDEAMQKGDEAAFKAGWHADAWEKNLVGGSGIPAEGVWSQGTRKKWYFKPDMKKARGKKGGWIVPCAVWSREKNRAVDEVHALAVQHDGKWILLGAGEDAEEVEALRDRWAKKEPLEPGR